MQIDPLLLYVPFICNTFIKPLAVCIKELHYQTTSVEDQPWMPAAPWDHPKQEHYLLSSLELRGLSRLRA